MRTVLRMSPLRRLWAVPVALLVAILLPFALWGERLGAVLSPDGTRSLFLEYESWAWALGIGLLVGDLFLPIPATVVMSALGWIYGPWCGGLVAAAGVFLSSYLAYGLSRGVGRPMAVRLAGAESIEMASAWFSRQCGLAVAFSRCLPVLNEAMACLAGLSLYPHRDFVVAALAGCVPVGFAFAWIGHWGRDHSGGAVALSVGVPIVLWVLYRRVVAIRGG
jgi:uncharacterized membrane protein YdjX (TVP38/TMEM64 family)